MNICYLCGSKTSLLYNFVSKKGKTRSILECQNCDLLRTFPIPNKNNLKAIYSKEFKYDVIKQSEVFRSKILEKLKEKLIVRPLLKDLAISFKENSNPTLLDIGCSTGWITSIANDVGFNAKGLEANPNAAAIAREKFGLDVYEGFVEDLDIEQRFDAVVMFHVLEHFVDPIATLEKVKSILKENGKLLIVVPNAKSIGTKIFKENYNWNIKHHISFFSEKSLEMTLQKSGLKKQKAVDLYSTPMLVTSFNKMMKRRKRNAWLSFKLKNKIFANLLMLPIGIIGKIIGRGEVMAVYASK